VVFQAYLEFLLLYVVICKVEFTGTQGDIVANKGKQFPNPAHGSERAQVFRPVGYDGAGKENAGEGLFFDNDIRIGLIVLKVDIIPGLKLFNEGVFQQKGILFGIYNGKFDVVDALYQLMGLIGRKGFDKIRAHPFAEAFGLTYI
jgi:hypothetical protein